MKQKLYAVPLVDSPRIELCDGPADEERRILFSVFGDDREVIAEFIVRACNAHDDLLSACKAIRADLDRPVNERRIDFEAIDAAIANAEGNA